MTILWCFGGSTILGNTHIKKNSNIITSKLHTPKILQTQLWSVLRRFIFILPQIPGGPMAVIRAETVCAEYWTNHGLQDSKFYWTMTHPKLFKKIKIQYDCFGNMCCYFSVMTKIHICHLRLNTGGTGRTIWLPSIQIQPFHQSWIFSDFEKSGESPTGANPLLRQRMASCFIVANSADGNGFLWCSVA